MRKIVNLIAISLIISLHGNLSLPDDKTINEIKEYCTQKKLILNISD